MGVFRPDWPWAVLFLDIMMCMSIDDSALATRIRALLADEASVREVTMFGGLAFMVDERLWVSIGGDGSLLVRVDPRRSPKLVLDRAEVRPAEMGGRAMGPAWLRVDGAALTDDQVLAFWVGEARLFNDRGDED